MEERVQDARKKADDLHEIWGTDWEQIEEHMLSDGFTNLETEIQIGRLQDESR